MTLDPTVNPLQNPTTAPSTAGMTTKVVKGSLWTLAGQVIPLGASLFATPFVIRLLGAEGYGVLILIGLIPSYLSFADFGMGIASTKFGSEAYGTGSADKEARVVRTAALIALAASAPIAAALFIFSSSITELFNVPEQLHAESTLALRIGSIMFVVNFLNNIFNTPQLARLRMDLNTLVVAGFRILGIIATPIVLYLGFGIVGAVGVLLLASLLILVGHIIISRRLLNELFGTTLDRDAFSSLLKFGGALTISAVAGILLANTEKGMLSAIISPSALAYYYVAFTLANVMTMFSGSMVQSLLPAFSQLQNEETRVHLNSLYSRGIRMNLIWLVPALVFLSLSAKPFLTAWAGEDFGHESVVPFYIMLGGIIVNIIAYFPHTAIIASGRTDVLAKLYWIEAVPYVLTVWLLTRKFGIAGAAMAWSIRVIVDAFIMFVLAKNVARVSYTHGHMPSFIAAVAIMMVPFVANFYFQKLTLTAVFILFAAVVGYSVVIWVKVLEKEEISWLLERVNVFAR